MDDLVIVLNQPDSDEERWEELDEKAWRRRTDRILRLIVRLIMADQDKLNALSTQLATIGTDLAAEIDALKNQPGAAALDFSGIDAQVATLQALDVANAPAPAASPAPTGSAGTTSVDNANTGDQHPDAIAAADAAAAAPTDVPAEGEPPVA